MQNFVSASLCSGAALKESSVLYSTILCYAILSSANAEPIENNNLLESPAKAKAADEKTQLKADQTVLIKGKSGYDPRREDTASKTVITSEEIRKHGDNSIYDVLKRAPGITVTGNTLRMRGLGEGYTQILINGDRPPPGFSMEALRPDQVERVEIFRSATAEHSMQAIAGTINIILKRIVTKAQRDLRFSVNKSSQSSTLNLGGTWADKKGNLSYFMNGMLFSGDSNSVQLSNEYSYASDGKAIALRESIGNGDSKSHGGMISPRLSWKINEENELRASALVQFSKAYAKNSVLTKNVLGYRALPDYVEEYSLSPNEQFVGTIDLAWLSKIAGGKLDAKIARDQSNYSNDLDASYYTANRQEKLIRDWETSSKTYRYSAKVKYSKTVFEGHSFVTGIDSTLQNNRDSRDRREQFDSSAAQFVQETFYPRIFRFSIFAQDEWNFNNQLSLYLGLRSEHIKIDTEASSSKGHQVRNGGNRSNILAPVVQTLYKIPGTNTRQLRVALTRTFKAPLVRQVSSRRYLSVMNNRFSPDSSGNPDLDPEQANGVDLTYEQFWDEDTMISVALTHRTISDRIVERLSLSSDGRWIISPVNAGDASLQSILVETKFPGKNLTPKLTGFDFRASFSKNWSSVSDISGPGNRLDQQVPSSATLGIDYVAGRLSMGVSYVWQWGGWVKVSPTQSNLSQTRKDLDAYALWKLSSRYQVRLSASNISRQDDISGRLYRDTDGVFLLRSHTKSAASIGVSLETTL